MTDIIKDWGALASSLLAIFGLIMFVGKPIRKFIKSHKDADAAQASTIKSMQDTLELHTAHNLDNYKTGLRLCVWSRDLPLVERVNAGEKYIALGGNGATAAKHRQNVSALEKEMRGNDG